MKKFKLLLLCVICVFSANAQNQIKKLDVKEIGKVKNIVLLIGDGMGVSQIYAGMTASQEPLNIESFKNIGFSKTYSASGYVTDSGAAGTAIATGKKTYDRAIGVDVDTLPQMSILEYAEMNGKSTGLVATSTITHATPASFIAHQPERYMYEDIADDFLKTDIDVFIGGGLKHFNDRRDHRDLTRILSDNGYEVVTNLEELQSTSGNKVAGLIYEDSPPKYSEGRGDMLPVSATVAVELLSKNENGFFLMIEGSQIDWGGHANDTEYIIAELLDFDRTVGKVLNFAKADGNTLVIVTADHETGGMGLVGGNMKEGHVEANFATGDHTGVMVPVFAFGPGSENFKGIYENTDLFVKMMNAFGFEQKNRHFKMLSYI
ncbi:MAG: alkaline phosphatase [Bacteroidales bacterium]